MLPKNIIGAPAATPNMRHFSLIFGVAKTRAIKASIDFHPTQSFIISTYKGTVFVWIDMSVPLCKAITPLAESIFSTVPATASCTGVASKLSHKRKWSGSERAANTERKINILSSFFWSGVLIFFKMLARIFLKNSKRFTAEQSFVIKCVE